MGTTTRRASTRKTEPNARKRPGLISPEHYAKVIEGLDLEDIRLEKLEAWQDADLTADRAGRLEIERESERFESDGLNAAITFSVKAFRGRKQLIRIVATYRVRFSSSHPVGDDFFEVFKEINLPVHVWPYFRELVQSMTGRMALPPLTLPLMKTGTLPVADGTD